MRYSAALILMVSGVAMAQTPRLVPPARSSNEARQPAETILAAGVSAHGGTALIAIQTIRLRGTSTVGTATQPLTISATLEGSSRVDWGNPVQRSMVTTSQGRFEIRAGTVVLRPPHSGAYTPLDVFSVLGIRNAYASGANRGVVGTVSLAGADVLRILAGTDRQQVHYGRAVKDEGYVDFDPATGRIAAVHRWEFADESLDLPFVTTHKFSDYRDVGGALLPYRIERFTNGKLKETIAAQSFEINPVFERGLFELER